MTLLGILISIGVTFAAVALGIYFYTKFSKTTLANASSEASKII
ncbi:unnamed protein product, partial [marine sediment metagenome]